MPLAEKPARRWKRIAATRRRRRRSRMPSRCSRSRSCGTPSSAAAGAYGSGTTGMAPCSARVEDRRDLADDPLVDQVLDARQHLVLGDARELRDARVRPRLDREAALHEVEQLPVELVQGDRRAVLAGPELGLGY